ncbi:MAG: glycosyltransferase family 4 protein [Bacillota bacterium]
MNVLMLSWEYPPKSVGGLARHVWHLSRALSRKGVEVHVITVGDDSLGPRQVDMGVNVHRVTPYRLNPPEFVPWVLQLNAGLLERAIEVMNSGTGADIIHCHDWLAAFAGRALKHAYRLPLVATIHATEHGRHQGIHNSWQRYIGDVEWWLTYESWRVICCSKYMRGEIQSLFQVPEDKMAVIRNGVDPAEFSTISRERKREEFAHRSEQVVFFVGRLVPEKGVQVLLDAVPEVRKVRPLTRFVIAGTGPSEPWLKAKASQMGIAEYVKFTGYIDDALRNSLYSWADVAVFPSTYEPFGLVALEGMAAGCPVVVSDCGGLSETVEHGIDGLKCRPGDAGSLASEVLHVLCDRAYGEYLKSNAHRKVASRYTWAGVADETLDVYREVLAEYRRSEWGHGQVRGRLEMPLLRSMQFLERGRYTRA